MSQEHAGSSFLYHTPCPSCHSSDANSMYSDGHQYCFTCGTYTKPEDNQEDTAVGDESFEEWGGEWEDHSPKEKFISGAYLPIKKRGGITIETCKKFDYAVAKIHDKPVHIANYRNKAGLWVAQHVRFADEKDFIWIGKANQVVLFGQHLFGSGGKRLVITEGELDCLSISQAFNNRWPTVSIPSGINGAKKTIQANLEWIESFQEVVLAFDDDVPGREGIQECAPLLTPGKCKVMSYGGKKDANEMAQAGLWKEITYAVYNAETYRPDGIISFGQLRDRILIKPEMGLEIPYPILNEKMQGLRYRELMLVTAGSGIGKSTLVHELGYHLRMVHGCNLGIMALEESPERTVWRYQSIHLNVPLHLRWSDVSDEDKLKAFDALRPDDGLYCYEHFGSTDIDGLMAKIRYMAVGLGCRFIILDHISIVVSGLDEIAESERKTIDKLMTRMRSLIEETNIGLLAVVHLKRPGGKGKSYNEGREVSLTDLRGSGSLEQLSDTVIAMERNQQHESMQNYSGIRVLKCRHTGLTGKADLVRYYPDTGRLLEANAEAEGFGDAVPDEFAGDNTQDF